MRRRVILLLLVLSALSAAVVFIPSQTRVCVIGFHDKSLIALLEDTFEISYTHSVNKGRVHDFYCIADNGVLRLTHTSFVSYGAGMPEPYGDQIFTVTDDAVELSNINMDMELLVLQTGLTANHVIQTGSRSIVLNEKIPPQTRVTITVRRVSRFDIWRMIHGTKR